MVHCAFRGLLAAALLVLALPACDREAGIGEACDTPGSLNDCIDGTICTKTSGGGLVCRVICIGDAGCQPGESCSGVSGSNLRSCQPK